GAAARAMLVAAAAKRWNVAPADVRVSAGVVSHGDRHATFGELAEAAAREAVPADVKLKEPKDYVYFGKFVPRTDNVAKTTGRAIYTQDIRLPGMLTAVVLHPPRFGAKVRGFDAHAAKAVAGVADVVQIPNGVAVLAKDFWSAKKGRDALHVDWDESAAFTQSTDDIIRDYRKLAEKPGAVVREDGHFEPAYEKAVTRIEAVYEFPFLAHAAMEPMNCVVRVAPGHCEVWNGEQFQTVDQASVARVLGLPPDKVAIHMLYAGGSFGRRANPHSDYPVEAATIAKAYAQRNGGHATVKLVWAREDDMRRDYYRPLYVHRLRAGLDAQGHVIAWEHRIVGQSILAGSPLQAMVKNGIDPTSVEGAMDLPYAIPNLSVELNTTKLPVPVQWWRSVGHAHTAYSTETMIDELAAKAKADPVAFRRQLLAAHPRHAGVLKLAADKAGWSTPLAPARNGEKRGRGVAVHKSFNTYVAQVAEVTVGSDGRFKVDRVVCAVDCGFAVNPDMIRAQMEGGLGYGLAAALYGKITLKNGAIEQSNFDGYPVLRINEMPAVEVYIVPSTEKPTGVGEPGTPPITPAVANAIAAATGRRLRTLPLVLT
ncbi:MAG TPA: xanthine dehydrogenase family protein molybdopterin-binding subunit, partial [Burkholderiales bacterium]|nr:xanthine dehydrogenase family protein molybdopterin-binding subunit [Burkholderiales bacterium]